MNIDDLTLGQVRELQKTLGSRATVKREELPFKVGEAILIRTVTMIQVGRVTQIGRDFLVLEDASWIADTGRFSTLLEKGEANEIERCPGWVFVGRGAIVDVFPWSHKLPEKTK